MNENKFIRFNQTGAMPYRTSIVLKPERYCNGFFCVNVGDTIVRVNGHILYPGTPGTSLGDAVTFGGNAGEIYSGNIEIIFNTGGANPAVTVDQKYYNLEK